MSVINAAIEIDTGTSVTDTNLGITSGVIRLITGRPGYDDNPITYPTYEDTSNNTNVYYEGFLTTVGDASRSVDNIKVTGDYSSESAFQFSIRNDSLYWSELESNDIYLVNKSVTYYIVIDDVFYSVWTGIVTDIDYSDTEYKIKCGDAFTKIHKKFPPVEINQTTYPNASDAAMGKPLPVCIGDVPYAQLVNIEGSAERIPFGYSYGQNVYSAAMSPESQPGTTAYFRESDGIYIGLKIQDVSYFDQFYDRSSSAVGNYYIRAVAGNGSNPEIMVRIIDQPTDEVFTIFGTSTNYVKFKIGGDIEGLQDAIDDSDIVFYADPPTDQTWYFQIVKLVVSNAVSNKNIVGFINSDNTGTPQLFEYDDNYKDISTSSIEADQNTNKPAKIKVFNDNFTSDLDVSTLSYHTPAIVRAGVVGTTLPTRENLSDRDRTTEYSRSWAAYSPLGSEGLLRTQMLLRIPDSIINADVDSISILIDAGVNTTGNTLPYFLGVEYAYVLDAYEHAFQENILPNSYEVDYDGGAESVTMSAVVQTSTATTTFCSVPDQYYANGGNPSDWTEGYTSRDSTHGSIPAVDLKIESSYLNKIRDGFLSPLIEVMFTCNRPFNILNGGSLSIVQAAFAVESTISATEGKMFARVNGEYYDGDHANVTNSVFGAITHILETYDGISSSDIDYNNLEINRWYWHVGRQLVKQQNSYQYLKELCKHSFLIGFCNRSGKRTFISWLDIDHEGADTHDGADIIAGSIKNFKRTRYYELYSDFSIYYNWDGQKYASTFKISNLDQSSFPDASTDTNSDGVEDWKEYLSGLADGSYSDAKKLWEDAQSIYERVGTLNELPKSLSDLPWFIDTTSFEEDNLSGTGTSSSAWRFLRNCVEWTGRNKLDIEYGLPITSDFVTLDIGDAKLFNDTLYTNGSDIQEWIYGITISFKNKTITINGITPPSAVDGLEIIGDIIETGSQTDTITESGSQTDTYTEGA